MCDSWSWVKDKVVLSQTLPIKTGWTYFNYICNGQSAVVIFEPYSSPYYLIFSLDGCLFCSELGKILIILCIIIYCERIDFPDYMFTMDLDLYYLYSKSRKCKAFLTVSLSNPFWNKNDMSKLDTVSKDNPYMSNKVEIPQLWFGVG